ncbi:unnamed protein product [Chrysoparadoxa australica]
MRLTLGAQITRALGVQITTALPSSASSPSAAKEVGYAATFKQAYTPSPAVLIEQERQDTGPESLPLFTWTSVIAADAAAHADKSPPFRDAPQGTLAKLVARLMGNKMFSEFHLLRRLMADTVAAMVAGAMVAPIVAIVDRTVVQTAAGMSTTAALGAALSTLASPLQFLAQPDLLWTWGVYAITYMAANYIRTFSEGAKFNPAIPSLVGTTAVNLPACVLKDCMLAKMLGGAAAASSAPVPMMSLALFALRDAFTMGACFSLPAMAAPMLKNACGKTQQWADNMSQMFVPLAAQLVATPLHILGLDLYNSPANSLGQHLGFAASESYKIGVLSVRFARSMACFGVGALYNRRIRDSLHTRANATAPRAKDIVEPEPAANFEMTQPTPQMLDDLLDFQGRANGADAIYRGTPKQIKVMLDSCSHDLMH